MVCEAVARREHPDFLAEGLHMCHKQAWLTLRSAIRANGDRAHFWDAVFDHATAYCVAYLAYCYCSFFACRYSFAGCWRRSAALSCWMARAWHGA
jgi:hypothetical protein